MSTTKEIQEGVLLPRVVDFEAIKVYVINLDESRQRWIQCHRALATVFEHSQIERVPAIHGKDFASTESEDGWNPVARVQLEAEGYLTPQSKIDPVRTALCLSHQRALRCFIEGRNSVDQEKRWALILEDDVRLGEAILSAATNAIKVALPADAEVVFLHDRVLAPHLPGTKTQAELMRVLPVTDGIGLEAYLVSETGASKVIDAMKPLFFECDVQLMAFASRLREPSRQLEFQQLMMDAKSRVPQRIHCYASERPLFQIDETLPSDKCRIISEVDSRAAEIAESATARSQFQFRPIDPQVPIGWTTCFFNPSRFRARVDNFMKFHHRLGECNLLVVELAFGEEDWQLPDGIPNLKRLRADAICWQKEALLNHGMRVLEQCGYPYLGWLDADIAFKSPDWQNILLAELRSKRLCQVFERVETNFPDQGRRLLRGAASSWVSGKSHPRHCGVTGFGWVMHADVWKSAGLFDEGILGGGDHVMWRSIFANQLEWGKLFSDRSYSNEMRKRLATWSKRWAESVQMAVGYAKGVEIKSMPHGDIKDRRYLSRNELLESINFDPQVHLSRDQWGLHCWSDQMPMEAQMTILEYFDKRSEDLEVSR